MRVILLIISVAAASPQPDAGELTIDVRGPQGQPVRAIGTLVSEAPQLQRSFETGDSGRFTLARLPFGVYRLSIAAAGFVPQTIDVEVHTALPQTVPVQLAPSPRLEEAIEVTAAPPLVDAARTGVTFTIGAPALHGHLTAVPGRRVLNLVDQQPGWLMEANGVLHPRGSEYQTLFVVDGLPMDENRSPAFAPDLQENEIQAMAVMTGNFPAEYGRKLGGVVEVTTGRDIHPGFRGVFEAGAGSFGMASGGGSVSHGWASRSVTVSASAARSDRYLDPPVRENFTNSGSLAGGLATYQDRPSDRDRWRIVWQRRHSDFLVPNEIVQQAAGQRQENDGRDHGLHAAWTRILGARAVLDVRGLVQHLSAGLRSNDASTPVIVNHDRSFTRRYTSASLAVDLGRHQIKFGGDLVRTPVEEALDYAVTDEALADEDADERFSFSDRRTGSEQALYVQDTLRAGRLTASLGLRWDRYAFVVNDTAFSPRLGVAWAAADDVVIRAAYDRVFQTPAVENLLLASSPLVETVSPIAVRLPVEPSRGHFFEAGVTAALGGRARLDATAYRRTFVNFADDDVFLNTGVSFPVAFAAAAVRGLDTKLTLPHWRRLSGFVSYALLEGTADLPVVGGLFLGEEGLEQLEGEGTIVITQDQRHTLRAHLRYDVGDRVWAGLTLRYGSGLPVELEGDDELDREELSEQYGDDILDRVDFENERVRANVALDGGVGAELWRGGRRRLTLRAELANLTNRLNVINVAGVFSGTALAPPRSAAVRMQFEF